jgi:hypothetical protein
MAQLLAVQILPDGKGQIKPVYDCQYLRLGLHVKSPAGFGNWRSQAQRTGSDCCWLSDPTLWSGGGAPGACIDGIL